jgi:hypothetical protein
MKITLDKNFFLVQFCFVIIFYLLNSFLINGKKSAIHFTTSAKSKKIESSDLMCYVLSQQYGVPGCVLTPVSKQAITIATIQKFVFVAYATGALVFCRKNIEYNIFNKLADASKATVATVASVGSSVVSSVGVSKGVSK